MCWLAGLAWLARRSGTAGEATPRQAAPPPGPAPYCTSPTKSLIRSRGPTPRRRDAAQPMIYYPDGSGTRPASAGVAALCSVPGRIPGRVPGCIPDRTLFGSRVDSGPNLWLDSGSPEPGLASPPHRRGPALPRCLADPGRARRIPGRSQPGGSRRLPGRGPALKEVSDTRPGSATWAASPARKRALHAARRVVVSRASWKRMEVTPANSASRRSRPRPGPSTGPPFAELSSDSECLAS